MPTIRFDQLSRYTIVDLPSDRLPVGVITNQAVTPELLQQKGMNQRVIMINQEDHAPPFIITRLFNSGWGFDPSHFSAAISMHVFYVFVMANKALVMKWLNPEISGNEPGFSRRVK